MRELKFRAWYNQSQTWVYFTFNQPMTDVAKAIHQNICLNGDIFYQFTGLTDKSGKDVYEGDILADPDRKGWDKENFVGYEVFFHDNDHCEYNVGFQMNRHYFYGSIAGTQDFKKFKPRNVSKMEIIGNIHENEIEKLAQ